MQELLKSPTQSDVKIAVRQLPEDSAPEEEIKRILRDVKKTGEVNIVLDCATERIQSVLKAAQQESGLTTANSVLLPLCLCQNLLTGLWTHLLFLSSIIAPIRNFIRYQKVSPQGECSPRIFQFTSPNLYTSSRR